MALLRSRCLLALATCGLLVASAWSADDDGFRPLFNGKDLAGWEGDPALWSVQDGAITGTTTDEARLPYNKFLIWRGGTLKNFELRAKVRQKGNNSGIQYRSKELKEVGPWSVGGYQCDIHPVAANNAMLYDERGRGIVTQNGQTVVVDEQGDKWIAQERPPVEVDVADWNEYTIIAKGNHLVHKINGQLAADTIDHQASERELEGILAIQVHAGPAMRVQIKDIQLKELPDGGVLSPTESPVPPGARKVARPAAKKKGAAKKAERKGASAPPADGAAKAGERPKDVSSATNEDAAKKNNLRNAARPPADDPGKKVAGKPAVKRGRNAATDTGAAVGANTATPLERLKVKEGFKVELLYSVPNSDQGSWVNLCLDNKDRIIASDQYGGLYRFPAPPLGRPLDPSTIEKVPADIRAINGMVWAFGALYVAVNDYERKIDSGLYRLTDSDGDDRLDKVELLRAMQARGDHGVHALVPSPDGTSLFLITGNGTTPTAFNASRVPTIWGEDHLLPRMPDGRGFMRDVLAPGGIVYRVSPDGKDFEVYSSGYRNIFDAAFNHDGELFTYDADMEYDFNTPWYRPTRVCHATSGSDFGWRNGAGKRPEFYPDTLPPVVNIGPGSPTGVTFGYGARFPAKYQEALFILDWSWGKLYAIHLKPEGSTYSGVKEEVLSGAPLPLTDAIVHPADGAMYFAIGGRKVQSGLYRLTYVGKESTAPVPSKPTTSPDRALRHRLEAFHGKADPQAVSEAWPSLGHADRFIRWAARTAIEHQPLATWADRAFAETDPAAQLEALMAAARVGGIDPFHRKPTDPPVDRALGSRLLDALAKLDWDKLGHDQKLTLVRTYEIVLNRFGRPDDAAVRRILAQLDPRFPAPSFDLNWLLCETLVYLQSPTVAAKGVALLQQAPTQEEQMEYARSLRMLRAGWTTETHRAYFEWFLKAANYRGGASFEKFIEFIRNDALAGLTEADKVALKDVLERKPVRKSPVEELAQMFAGRTPTNWTLDELAASVQGGLAHRSFENGRKMFGAAACFTCHRFGNEGGMTGPDLTGAGGRYSPRDLLDQVLNPSKEINEQFVPIVIRTKDEEVITGVIVNLNGDRVMVNTDPADPNQQVAVDRKQVLTMEPSNVSPMPTGLLNPLTRDEILDLTAYVLSGGNPRDPMFRK